MVMNHVNTLFRQAVTTFSCSKEFLHPNLEILKTLLDKLTAADVGLNPQFLTEALWNRPGKAPVTYIDIQETDLLTMGIFILSPGMKIPLHDHPQMYGLIKVLAGKLKLTSFSVVDEETLPAYFNSPIRLKVEKNPELIIDTTSETSFLEPSKNNIHEIESIDGPAAFLDILSPPYETETESGQLRKCTYFTVVERLTEKLFRLMEIRPPSWFWSDSFQYEGPEVLLFKKKHSLD